MKKFLLCILAAMSLAFAASCGNNNLPDGTSDGAGNGNVPPAAEEEPNPPQDDGENGKDNQDGEKGWSPWVK